MQTGAAIVESRMEISEKIKNETALWLSSSTSGNISEETQNTNSKEYIHPCVHCSVIYDSWDLEASQVTINRGVYKKAMVHLYYLAMKKQEILTFTTACMDLKTIMLSEISQAEKNKYHMISFPGIETDS